MECPAQLQEGQGERRKKRQLQVGEEGPSFCPPAMGEDTWDIQHQTQPLCCRLFSGVPLTEAFSTGELTKQRNWEEGRGDSRKLSRGACKEKRSHGDTTADMTITPGEGGSLLSKSSWGQDSVAWKKG